MAALNCDPDCSGCSFATASDCTRFSILAAYSEEAGDTGLDRLGTSLGTCVLSGNTTATSAEIIRMIKAQPDMPCSKSSDVSEDLMAASVTLIGFSVFVLVNTVLQIDSND